jgi:predicted enzyme related to lactoylglutathione lyase
MCDGAFSWVGLLTSDIDSAASFYGDLFGWEAVDEDGSGYAIFRLDGEDVALVYEITDTQRSLGAIPNWASFVSVADVVLTAACAAELGGAVVIPPYDAAGAGRIAVIQDPAGARLSLWEPRAHPGPRHTGAIGTCCWNELATPDLARARRFYSDLFGWQIVLGDDGGSTIRTAARVEGGMRELAEDATRNEPTRWLPYFAAESLAGGPAALLRDREGAAFGLRKV